MKPFIIMGNSRTGTSFLRSSINSHPDVYCFPEILNQIEEERKKCHQHYLKDDDWLKIHPGRSLKELAVKYLEEKIWPENVRSIGIGFKVIFNQIDMWDTWEYLEEKDLNYIFTVRNQIARYVSYLQAKNSDEWDLLPHEKVKVAPPVKIDMNDFYLHLRKRRIQEEKAVKMFKKLHIVHYNDMVRDYDNTMSKVFKYLGLSQHKAHPKSKKQQSWDFRLRVKNFNEFSKKLKDEYKYMLNDIL